MCIIKNNYLLQENTFLYSLDTGRWDSAQYVELTQSLREHQITNKECKYYVFHIFRFVNVLLASHYNVNDCFIIQNFDDEIGMNDVLHPLQREIERILCEM